MCSRKGSTAIENPLSLFQVPPLRQILTCYDILLEINALVGRDHRALPFQRPSSIVSKQVVDGHFQLKRIQAPPATNQRRCVTSGTIILHVTELNEKSGILIRKA